MKTTPKIPTPEDWNRVRVAFAASMLADTPLVSLGQALDGVSWPASARDDTPATYLDLDYDDVIAELIERGLPGTMIRALVEILAETLAFDAPFSEMAANAATAAERDNPVLQNLEKLGIDGDFPLRLAALDEDTRDFCAAEEITTLEAFALKAQEIAQQVVVAGDFRTLLGALSFVDERALARYLPYRPGSRGLHLERGLGLAFRGLGEVNRTAVAFDLGVKLDSSRRAAALTVDSCDRQRVISHLKRRLQEYLDFFVAEAAELRVKVVAGEPIARQFIELGDPLVEQSIEKLLTEIWPKKRVPHVATRSWWARLRASFAA